MYENLYLQFQTYVDVYNYICVYIQLYEYLYLCIHTFIRVIELTTDIPTIIYVFLEKTFILKQQFLLYFNICMKE